MLALEEIHLYVSDFDRGLRFWGDGLQLTLAEFSRDDEFARLEFPEGGPSLRISGGVMRWGVDERPPPGTRPGVSFDVATTEFDDVLVRLIEHGGRQESDVEVYNGLRVVTLADPDGNSFDLIELPREAEGE